MDRVTVYPGQVPLDTDVLSTNRNAMIESAYLAQAILGTATWVDGLACTPTAPATMTVTVGTGSIFMNSSIDATAYGSLAADTSDPLYKHGINPFGSTSFTLTAPASSGQTINYLIEATLVEADGGSTVLPYYNASNPAQPFTGPNNSGAPQTTLRSQRVGLQLKAGAAATTGTQVTPSVDSGWVGLYVISVNFGQTTVTSSSITLYPNAPFINPKLTSFSQSIPVVRTRATGALTLFVNGSTGNDNNNGLSSSSPFKTLQAAMNNLANNYDMAGFTPTISIADGTYTVTSGTPVCKVLPVLGAPIVQFVGNTGTPGNVIVNAVNANCWSVQSGAIASITGVTFTATGSFPTTGQGVSIQRGGLGSSGGAVVFGACAGGHIVNGGGGFAISGAYSITGSAVVHFYAAECGSIDGTNLTVTLSGSLNFSTAFAQTLVNGTINIGNPASFTGGTITGARYNASLGGVIDVQAQSTSLFPGNTAGVTSTGGQYG